MGPTDRVFRDDNGPLEYTPNDDFDIRLIAAREALTDWDIYKVAYGYLAVPGGTPVYMSVQVDGLVAKLRKHQNEVS